MHHAMATSDTHAKTREVRAVLALQTAPLAEADAATDVAGASTASLNTTLCNPTTTFR